MTSSTRRRAVALRHRARPNNAERTEETHMTERDIIARTLDRLSDHYAHKVMVYALTLLDIQEKKKLTSRKS